MSTQLADYMARALVLARQALGSTSPNPPVGAVVVKDGKVVGEGYTQLPGGPHAEVVALQQAGEAARGATLYVTLEPCCHYGRTPPCTQAILRAGVAEVHYALQDSNPLVNGGGRRELEEAGVRVMTGEGADEAMEVTEAYLKFARTGLPFVAAKFAASLDGKIATSSGESQWITGEAARSRANKLRAESDAVMVGINTVLRDDPRLTVRDESGSPTERQPLRVVVDSQARTPPEARLLRQPGRTLIATADPPRDRRRTLEAAGAEVIAVPGEEKGRVDLVALLKALAQRNVVGVLAEGGGSLLGGLFDQGLVDKVIAFLAPLIIGGAEAPPAVGGKGIGRLADAWHLERMRVEHLDGDLVVTGYPQRGWTRAQG